MRATRAEAAARRAEGVAVRAQQAEAERAGGERLARLDAQQKTVAAEASAAAINLGVGYQNGGKPDLALPLYEEAWPLIKARLGADHPDTLNTMNNLAWGYQATGKLDLAVPLFEKAVKLHKARLGADHPDTLTALNNLATAYQAAGKADLALPLLEEALKLRKARLGPEHPDTIISMGNLAGAYTAAGKLELALPLWSELSVANPRDTSASLQLASLQVWFGKVKEYAETVSRTLRVARETQDAPTADRASKLSSLRPGDDRETQAASLALAAKAVDLGKNNRFLGFFQMALGMAQYRSGLLAEANATFAPLAEKERNNRHIAHTVGFYRAMTLFRLGEADDAKKLATATAGVMRPLPLDERNPLANGANADDIIVWLASKEAQQSIGFASPDRTEQLTAHCSGLLRAKQYAEAEPFLREGLTHDEKSQPEVWSTFNTRSMLGGALLGQKKYAEAEPLLLDG